MAILFDHLDREQASVFSLVLNSAGIGHEVIGWEGGSRIEVAETDLDGARDAIYRYLAENPSPGKDESVIDDPPKALDLSGVAVALLLLAIHLAVTTSAAPQDYINVFGANARRILGGEWYRCATALLLHADAAHIAGNMAGVALFGGAVCAVTGVGVGWLMILACGILGNLMNAVAYETGHLSIGASTAIFGAVGIVSAIQAVNAARTGKGWKRMFLALGAGVASGADAILIPEIPYNLEKVARAIRQRQQRGNNFSIVVVAEGALAISEKKKRDNLRNKKLVAKESGDLKKRKKAQEAYTRFSKKRQEHTLRLSQQLEELTGLESRLTILGHLQRGGTPSATDRVLATKLGSACVRYIEEGIFNAMIAVRGDGTEAVPLGDVVGKRKIVPQDHCWIESARAVGTCLGD